MTDDKYPQSVELCHEWIKGHKNTITELRAEVRLLKELLWESVLRWGE